MNAAPIPVEQVRFVKELYPRLREDDAAVERYRAAVDLLPPIVVARDGVLVDGFHRWQAHRKEGRTEITAENLGDLTDVEILTESIRRNATHGQQLTSKDKARLSVQLWPGLDKDGRVAYLADLLAVSRQAVENWTKEARTAERRAQRERAWDLWLDCLTQQAIADDIGVAIGTINTWLSEMPKMAELNEPPESRQHFDVWSFQTATGDSSYFGKMPPQIVENLLWLYTEPGQTVVDPFAGGGTTIDVAKAMGRRVWASDRKPSTPTLPIHQWDITTGWPKDAPSKADLVLLDPPYWQQAKGRYSDDPEDLGNMTLDDFITAWDAAVKACADHLTGYLAFIVSPAQTDDDVVDLAHIMYRCCEDLGLKPHRRIIATYNTQQATGQQVTWARENRQLLKLYRDVVVMRP